MGRPPRRPDDQDQRRPGSATPPPAISKYKPARGPARAASYVRPTARSGLHNRRTICVGELRFTWEQVTRRPTYVAGAIRAVLG